MRSKLLLNLFGGNTNSSSVVVEVLSKALTQTPSSREIMVCSIDSCKYSFEILRPYLSMAMNVFENKMDNIERSIWANMDSLMNCRVCEGSLCVEVRREFGQHLFIEVC